MGRGETFFLVYNGLAEMELCFDANCSLVVIHLLLTDNFFATN